MRRNKILYYFLNFIIPIFIILFFSLCTKNLFNIDDCIDYLILGKRALTGINAFFSFNIGLGIDIFNIRSIYANSLLNLLLIFFDNKNINIYIFFVSCLRIGLMNLFMSIYLNSITDNKYNLKNILFCLMYSLSSFVLLYVCDIKFVDTVVLLPLVILGLDKLIIEDNSKLYITFLSLCIFQNVSVLFIIFVFNLLYYVYKSIIVNKYNIKTFGRFLISSIISIFINSIVVIPYLYNGISFNTVSGYKYLYYFIMCIILVVLFFFNKKFDNEEKFSTLLLLILSFLLSFITGYMFLFLFIICVISFKCFSNISSIDFNSKIIRSIFIMLIILFVILSLLFNNYLFYSSIILLILYYFCFKYRRYVLVYLIILCELITNVYYVLNHYDVNFNYNNDDIVSVIKNDNGFYRNYLSDSNISAYYNINNVSSDIINRYNGDEYLIMSLLGIKYYYSNSDKDYEYVYNNLYKIKCLDIIFGIDMEYGNKNDIDGIYNDLLGYEMNDNNYDKYINEINNKVDHFYNIEINKINYIFKGNINVSSDEKVFSTIPYTDSYDIFIDGNKIEYYKIYDSFVGFDIDEGEHSLKIVYSPKGYKKGAILSLLFLIIAICFTKLEYYYKLAKK